MVHLRSYLLNIYKNCGHQTLCEYDCFSDLVQGCYRKLFEEDQKEKSDKNKERDVKYLYFELLKMVDVESKNQLNKLKKDITLADEHKDDWNKLVEWDIPDEYKG